MTTEAVHRFIGRGVIDTEFREKLNARKMSLEEIAAVDRGLDIQDVNAIVWALLNTPGDFPSFSAEIGRYLDIRYRHAGPSGDDLPISV